jgi:hypothetical protein
MGLYRAALLIASAALLTFGVVFTLLHVTRSAAAPSDIVVPLATAEPLVSVADSLATQLVDGQIAVGVPTTGSEPLLRDVQPGDRVDVVASLPSPEDGRPVTAVLVRGATVLRSATASQPLLLKVPAQDAMVLAHLVLSGTQLGYAIWPADGSAPVESRPLDERTARALLGLAATATAVPVPPTPTAVPPVVAPAPPTLMPERPAGSFIYQVQPGDTWDSVAAIFTISATELRQWNDAPPGAGLAPDALLVIRRTL